MRKPKTLTQIIEYGLSLFNQGLLYEDAIVKVKLSSEEREEVYSDMLKNDIDSDYIDVKDTVKNKGFYRFKMLGLYFEIE